MLQVRMPGNSLDFTYHDLPHHTKCAIATRVGEAFASLHTIRCVAAGRPTMSLKEIRVARFRDPEERWTNTNPDFASGTKSPEIELI
ncbi:hypothetical protein N7488_004402 [Penicillium malachiteum]|nr:hypothetical protein N7488_004402 [Penicillium malachiteum]